jgi:endonuclease V-like protein UPF0215 family
MGGNVKRTGVFATADEIERMKAAARMPYMVVGGVPPESAAQVAHRLALRHGLPEIPGYYGCDLRTGEFVSA